MCRAYIYFDKYFIDKITKFLSFVLKFIFYGKYTKGKNRRTIVKVDIYKRNLGNEAITIHLMWSHSIHTKFNTKPV